MTKQMFLVSLDSEEGSQICELTAEGYEQILADGYEEPEGFWNSWSDYLEIEEVLDILEKKFFELF